MAKILLQNTARNRFFIESGWFLHSALLSKAYINPTKLATIQMFAVTYNMQSFIRKLQTKVKIVKNNIF